MPVSSSTSRVSPSTIDSPSWTSITPPGVDQSSDPFRRRFCTSKTPSGPSMIPLATSQSRIRWILAGCPAMHANVEAVVAAAQARGITIQPREFPDSTRTAADAAAAIGVPVGAIVKSLVFLVDERPVVALVSGDNLLDEGKLAAAAGGKKARRPDANAVRDATGFPIGGIPPFGHRNDLPVYVDEDLFRFDVVWAAAGTPHVNFSISPADLLAATGGRRYALGRAGANEAVIPPSTTNSEPVE